MQPQCSKSFSTFAHYNSYYFKILRKTNKKNSWLLIFSFLGAQLSSAWTLKTLTFHPSLRSATCNPLLLSTSATPASFLLFTSTSGAQYLIGDCSNSAPMLWRTEFPQIKTAAAASEIQFWCWWSSLLHLNSANL